LRLQTAFSAGVKLETPYYFVDERKLLRNLRRVARLKRRSGARCVLALKCFSTWAVFPLLRQYLDGTTSSALHEVRLGHEEFGGETHAYCVGYKPEEMSAIRRYADKVIFNSVSQLERLAPLVRPREIALRVNPGVSYSHFDLADPACAFSRLGVRDPAAVRRAIRPFGLAGLMFHFNCENGDFPALAALLDRIEREWSNALDAVRWVSLGGGIAFTNDGYPLDALADRLRAFAQRHGVQVYLEPGEAVATRTTELVATVVDIVRNRRPIAILDASTEAHMLDLLIYREPAKGIAGATGGPYRYRIAGRTCLAGDVFGDFAFPRPLRVGQQVRLLDAGGYTMVKKNWFNGIAMPSIAIRRLDGTIDVTRRFDYTDFKNSLS